MDKFDLLFNETNLIDLLKTNNNFLSFYNKINDLEYKNIFNSIIDSLSNDLSIINSSQTKDIVINTSYNSKDNEIDILVSLIFNELYFNDNIFNLAISYYDKYEQLLIDNSIYNVSIDFEVNTQNETVKTITVISNG